MSAYLDGELAAGRRIRIERHVGECVECRRLLAGLRLTLEALHRLRTPEGGTGAAQVAASVRVRLKAPPGPH
jgi:anti-sigma factor RsiW